MGNRRVQAVEGTSVLQKRFRKVIPSNSSISDQFRGKAPAVAVVIDLRKGVLESLDLYLRINRGIPDRIVAVELRKLLGGSFQRARYRVIATEHPDGPPPTRGRRRSKTTGEPTERQRELAAALRAKIQSYGSVESAVSAVADVKKTSIRAVYRAQRTCLQFEAECARKEAERLEILERRENALARMRENHPRT